MLFTNVFIFFPPNILFDPNQMLVGIVTNYRCQPRAVNIYSLLGPYITFFWEGRFGSHIGFLLHNKLESSLVSGFSVERCYIFLLEIYQLRSPTGKAQSF